MTMSEFIKQHRDELVAHIKRRCPNCRVSTNDIREWVLNDEDLYLWARREGVKV